MSAPVRRFPYLVRDPDLGRANLARLLPLTLEGRLSVAVTGLLDSGAAIFDVLRFRQDSSAEITTSRNSKEFGVLGSARRTLTSSATTFVGHVLSVLCRAIP